MANLKSLQQEIKELTKALRPDIENITQRYYLLAEMKYRSHYSYRPDGPVKDDEEFLRDYAESFMSLEEFIKRNIARRTNPFSEPVSSEEEAGRSKGVHVDFSNR
jgi:hypothetical protein